MHARYLHHQRPRRQRALQDLHGPRARRHFTPQEALKISESDNDS
jgi:hypothetical protein